MQITMTGEPTGRELELHNYLLAHGAKQASNIAHTHTLDMQGIIERRPDAMFVSVLFWSEEHQQHFWADTVFSRSLLDDPDLPIKALGDFVLRQTAAIDEIGPPL